jgi:hypothetical protein
MGVMAGLNFPSYNTNDTIWTGSLGGSSVDGNLGWVFGLLLGWDFGLLTGEVEALVSFDKAEIDTFSSYSIYNNIAYMEGMSIHIPLLVKMDFHLGPVVLQPLAGPYFNFALGKLNISGSLEGETSYKNPLVGLTAGGVVGLNLGRGFIFVDGRFEIDLGKTKVESIEIWRRSAFVVNLGYQIYLGRKQ